MFIDVVSMFIPMKNLLNLSELLCFSRSNLENWEEFLFKFVVFHVFFYESVFNWKSFYFLEFESGSLIAIS